MKDNDVVIYKLLDEFNRSREAIVQFLRNKGFSCEQAHAKIMRFQSETQIAYREFKNTGFTDGGFQFTMEDGPQHQEKIKINEKDFGEDYFEPQEKIKIDLTDVEKTA